MPPNKIKLTDLPNGESSSTAKTPKGNIFTLTVNKQGEKMTWKIEKGEVEK